MLNEGINFGVETYDGRPGSNFKILLVCNVELRVEFLNHVGSDSLLVLENQVEAKHLLVGVETLPKGKRSPGEAASVEELVGNRDGEIRISRVEVGRLRRQVSRIYPCFRIYLSPHLVGKLLSLSFYKVGFELLEHLEVPDTLLSVLQEVMPEEALEGLLADYELDVPQELEAFFVRDLSLGVVGVVALVRSRVQFSVSSTRTIVTHSLFDGMVADHSLSQGEVVPVQFSAHPTFFKHCESLV